MKRYLPLVVLVVIAALAAKALSHSSAQSFAWMHYFMGFFFCQFAMLKLFNVSGFAEGFEMYDLVAKKLRGYALVYPFIELGLGLSYLAFFRPMLTYTITVIVMGVSAIGVVRALRKGLDVRCACMGTVLNVPLSTVTLTEDLVMGVMALWMLLSGM
ncbi:MAG: hypothetical protein JSR58_06960 [Verrucomicrobia bacterium]|nr:hypothetical protein [Verrucomicrobiota bacterium]